MVASGCPSNAAQENKFLVLAGTRQGCIKNHLCTIWISSGVQGPCILILDRHIQAMALVVQGDGLLQVIVAQGLPCRSEQFFFGGHDEPCGGIYFQINV